MELLFYWEVRPHEVRKIREVRVVRVVHIVVRTHGLYSHAALSIRLSFNGVEHIKVNVIFSHNA